MDFLGGGASMQPAPHLDDQPNSNGNRGMNCWYVTKSAKGDEDVGSF